VTSSRIIIAALFLIASTTGAAPEPATEPDIKPGEFILAGAPQPAPEISFGGLDGTPLALADFKGGFLILNLWATWCQPCLKEMPSLERLQTKLGPALAVLAVSEDRGGAAVVEPYIVKLGLDKLKVGLDPQSSAIQALHLRGLPTSLVIDGEGRIVGKVEGGADWDSDELRGALAKLMPAASPVSSR
jgi:thiol-disulfide isomerase/thioredoxin